MSVFQSIRRLARQEERARWAVQRQMAKCTRITPTYSRQPKGGGSSQRMEENVILLGMLRAQHEEILAQLRQEQARILPLIRRLRDGPERTAMTLRYKQNMTILEIGAAMGYSERQIFRILERAEIKVAQRLERKEAQGKDGSTCQGIL